MTDSDLIETPAKCPAKTDARKMSPVIDKREFAILPRWAIVAFVARCGRRVLPLYVDDEAAPAEQRMAASQAIRLAEERASLGGEFELNDALVIGGQYYDNHDIDSMFSTLSGSVNAALNTYADLDCADEASNPGRPMLAVTSLAQIAFHAAFNPAYSQREDLAEQAEKAVGWASLANKALESQILSDFRKIRSLTDRWVDQTPFAPSVFGDP